MRSMMILPLLLAGCMAPVDMEVTAPAPVAPIEYHIDPPAGGPIVVAVYGYADLTGQRAGTTLSSAVSQGADNYLIDALKGFSHGEWFRVVERKSIDNIVRERQIIRSSRITVDPEAEELPPMMYAGIIVEGGVIGYDSNVTSGGDGGRVFGVGVSQKFTRHIVTVSLRTISVASSEVLNSVIVEKEILSYSENATVMKFFDFDTETIEIETGSNTNEAPSYALQATISKAVYELVRDGQNRGLW